MAASSQPTPSSQPSSSLRRTSIFLNVSLQLLLLLALFGVANYLSYRHYERLDLSPEQDFTLSETTVNYLRRLPKDVHIITVFTRDSQIMQEVRSLVDEYRRVKRSRIRTDEVDPARDVERAEQLKAEYGVTLSGNGILVAANDRVRFIPEQEIVLRGLNGDRDNPSVDFRGEDALTSAIIGLIEGGVRRFYYIVGKGDATGGKASEPSYTSLASLGKRQNFEVAPLNLTEVTSIPTDANGLVLVGPKYDLSEREINMIKEYWQGKRVGLLILLDPNGETPRLKEFLESQGVTPRPDRVLTAESTSAGPKKEFSVQTVFMPESIITQPFTNVSASFSGQTQSLDLKTDSATLRAQQIAVTPIINAAEKFWGETRYLMELPRVDKEDAKAPVHVAASVERGGVSDDRIRMESARMVIVGNALLLDPATRLGVHEDFIGSSLNWMLNRERLMGIMPKRKQTFRLQLSENARKKTFWITGLLMPTSVLALGMIVWSFRRS